MANHRVPGHRHDWVWVDRAIRGRATAAQLAPRELAEAVYVLRHRRWSDSTIAQWLHTNNRRITAGGKSEKHGKHPHVF